MKLTIKKYLFNCFLLTVPILIWNLVLTDKLPAQFQPKIFWNDIPTWLTYGENISRTLIFTLTILMPLSVVTPVQKKGVVIYIAGVLLYFTSWMILIFSPNNIWSNTLVGFMAPAYTPLFWLGGIGLIGDSFYFNLPYKRFVFILLSIIFLLFHNTHTYIIYCRTH